jgi:hypothetical protein
MNYATSGTQSSAAIFAETFFAKDLDKVRVCSSRVKKQREMVLLRKCKL